MNALRSPSNDPQLLDLLQSVFDDVSAIQKEQDQQLSLLITSADRATAAAQMSHHMATMKAAGLINMSQVVNPTDKDHLGSAKNLAAALRQIGVPTQAAFRKMFTAVDIDEYGAPMVEDIHVLQFADGRTICPALGCSHIGWLAIEQECAKKNPNATWSKDVYTRAFDASDPRCVDTLVDIIKRQQALHSRNDIECSLAPSSLPPPAPFKKM